MLKATKASEIAKWVDSHLIGEDVVLTGVCSLGNLGENCLAFSKAPLRSDQEEALKRLGSVVLLVRGNDVPRIAVSHIPVPDPRVAFAIALTRMQHSASRAGVSPTAVIHPSAKIAESARIGENVIVGEGSRIGANTEICANTVIGPSVVVGEDCLIKSNSVIGQAGFGFVQDDSGNNFRLPHIGGVVIGNHVEIGALTTICAGTLDPTIVENYAKIDDHVFVAHNVRVGENCILVACSEISGSVVIGPRAWLGPNCCIIDGIAIGRGAFIGMGAVVTKTVPERAVMVGSPARVLRIAEQDAVPASA